MIQVKKSKKKVEKKSWKKRGSENKSVNSKNFRQFNIKNISGALTSHSNLTRFVSFELFVF